MSIADVEATLSDAARQERQTVGGETISFNTVSVTKMNVRKLDGSVVDVEIPTVDKVDHKSLGRPVDKQYANSRNMVVSRLNLTKWAEATVISALPIVLTSDSCLFPLQTAKVPSVKDGEEYTFLTFKNPHLEPARIGPDAPLACIDFQPIQLAKEFELVYESHGGVFAFIGKPEDAKNPNWEHRAAWEAAKKRAVAYMESMHREARQFWDQKVFYGVRETHRACIRRLYHLGYLKSLPEELDKQRDINVEYPTCPKCQKRAESPHAVECLHCHWILDPRFAFENNIIEETSPHLERLTRATVKEMGISPYVAETIDEKAARLSAGLPKPKSEAAMRLEEQHAELDEQSKEADAAKLGTAVAKAIKTSGGKAKDKQEPEF